MTAPTTEKPGFRDEDTEEDNDVASLLGTDVAAVYEKTRHWSADRKAAMMAWLRAQHTRETVKKRYRNPAELASAVDPTYVVTPAIAHIAKSVERVIQEPRRNLLVTMPPQEGKSNLCAVWAPIRALQVNPNCRVILATYGDSLAEDHSRSCQEIINTAGTGAVDSLTGLPLPDKLGLQLAHGRTAVSGWRVKGGKGGMVAVGLGSSITGRPADLMIIDDPYKNMQEANSDAHRKKVEEWMKSVAFTRLSPDASVILIQTRWHPDDLAGSIMKAELEAHPDDRSWRHINIPAVAEVGVPDALGREPGTPMISARGRTAQQFAATRRNVGELVWFALYEGVPAPPEGGLFSRKWFDSHRIPVAPEHPVFTVVAIDPADSGKNDEAGIVSASLYGDGKIAFTNDRSERMTSDQWARAAIQLAMETGAREIAMEAYSTATTYARVVKSAWREIAQEVRELHSQGQDLYPWQRKVLAAGEFGMPFQLHLWRGKGDAVARSGALRQAIEVGTAAVVGQYMTVFEDQAATWQQGQHQPDRVAAALIAHDRLEQRKGQTASYANPAQSAARVGTNTAWLSRKLA
jgi:hypothetical protein